MENILDQQRDLHEERERLEQAMVVEMMSKKPSQRDRIISDHKTKKLMDRYIGASEKLLDYYEDKDGTREQVINNLKGPNELSQFYSTLKNIKQFYSKHTDDTVVPISLAFHELELTTNDDNKNDDGDEKDDEAQSDKILLLKVAPDLVGKRSLNKELFVTFTDEESFGRYLDLVKLHEQYLNLKGIEKKIDYLTYLNEFDLHLQNLPLRIRTTNAYVRYLRSILEYLENYIFRIRPLFDFEKFKAKVEQYFDKQWNLKKFPGWSEYFETQTMISNEKNTNSNINRPLINLEHDITCIEQLYGLGLDKLKYELLARNLKCGGRLEERAQRLWHARGRTYDEIDSRHKLSSAKIQSNCNNDKKQSVDGENKSSILNCVKDKKEIAKLEALILKSSQLLESHRLATIENVQRKQARTANELAAESDDDNLSEQDDEGDDADGNQGDVIYNPKNLPLGWDGKPIPYWLYKLHGLNQTFTCEICGDCTYKGPKAFQRHFADWRHAHGMRCLGIPNTAHFANITKIQDAINLWNKLKREKQKDRFDHLNEEEYEDSQGNVVNKKTYEDLKRQGLL